MFENQRKVMDAKACPFCGRQRVITQTREFYERHYYGTGSLSMRCDFCGAEIWSHPRAEMTYQEAYHKALSKWNRRAN